MLQYENDNNLSRRISLYAYGTNRVSWSDWFFRFVPLNPRTTVLDVGCGNAALWASQTRPIPNDTRVVLADQSPGMIRAAQQSLRAVDGNWEFQIASVERLPFESQSFDVVIANHMLYHAADMSAAVHELGRVLKPDGVALASTNGDGHLRQLCEWAVQCGLSEAAETLKRIPAAFGLANGAGILNAVFAIVATHRYSDSLAIPDAAPVLGYVKSMQLPDSGEKMKKLGILLEQELVKNGKIVIDTDSGVVEARHAGLSEHAS